MCGIWGILSEEKINLSYGKMYELFQKIKNRGPDKSTFIDNMHYVIGFHRLAIMDQSINGDQPFSYSYKYSDEIVNTIYVICNGEIYNYKELKKEIDEYTFKSDSDCEVLLALYLKYKNLNFVKRLNGEFAFAVYDIKHNIITNEINYSLNLTRDNYGIRPLFYTQFRICFETRK